MVFADPKINIPSIIKYSWFFDTVDGISEYIYFYIVIIKEYVTPLK